MATEIASRFGTLPDGITEANITTWLGYVKNDLTNYTGESISISDVPDKYQNILINLGLAYVTSRKINAQIGFNISLGEFSVSAPTGLTGNIQFFIDLANSSLQSIGRNVPIERVWGG